MPFQKGHKLAKGGPRPNSGPKPLATRALCHLSFHKRVRVLAQIFDDTALEPRDRIAALKVLASIGVPRQHEHELKVPATITLAVVGLEARD